MARIEIKGREFQKKATWAKCWKLEMNVLCLGTVKNTVVLSVFFSNYDECEIRLG